jgi:hypothetical protein
VLSEERLKNCVTAFHWCGKAARNARRLPLCQFDGIAAATFFYFALILFSSPEIQPE